MLIQDVLEHNARTQPLRVALVAGKEEVTYRELRDRVRGYADVLRSGGIGNGDRVAILAQNSILYLEALFAVTRAGAALVPLNHLLIGRELVAILQDADVKALLFTEEFLDRIGEIRPSLPEILCFVRIDDPDLPGGGEEGAQDPSPPVLESDTAMVIYDGGTTARPRGAMLSHRNLLAASASSALELSLSRNDVFLSCASLPFLGGTGRLLRFIYVGATIVLQAEFDPEEALRAIERQSVTRVLLTPTMMSQILDLSTAGKFNLSTLRTILYGGGVIPLDLLKRAIRFFRCGLVQVHGLLESSGILTVLHEEDHSLDESTPYMRKLMSVGKEANGVEVRVVGEDGREIAPNEVGEVVARGPNVFEGYRNDPGLTAKVLRDGWLRTGDVASIDEEGYIYIIDRKRDTLMVEGISVSPREIEKTLCEHPSVKESAVVACPDYTLGEVPVAVVVAREGAKEDAETILEHCRKNMAPFKVPRSVQFVPALPRNAQGKVLKAKIRDCKASRKAG
ncbi:MAG TPA: AMP-binding protein [Candidatus Methylomirabilis sp.]|nr:AMP-binding protein [Candidatus Methylomirabilis sp.]